MKIKIKEISHSDMSLYFEGTYARVLREGKPPVWASYSGSSGESGFLFSDGEHSYTVSGSTIVESTFPVGFFNREDTKSVMYGERISLRQNNKGLHFGKNYQLFCMETLAADWGILKCESTKLAQGIQYWLKEVQATKGINGTVLTQMFENSKYPSPQDAFNQVKNQIYYTRALSQDFALMPHSQNDNLLVFHHKLPVGELESKWKLKTIIPQYKHELKKFFEPKEVSVQ